MVSNAICPSTGTIDREGFQDHTGRLLLVAEEDRDRWGLRFGGLFSDTYLDELATFRL